MKKILFLLIIIFSVTGFSQVEKYTYRVVNVFPHDISAFTQGLVYADGFLYEGTGMNGESTLRKVEIKTGNIVELHSLDAQFFGEGVTVFGDRIIQLTWQSNMGFSYDRETFLKIEEFYYPEEGWGLTNDGTHLIMSDGSAKLRFLDPYGFNEVRSLVVTENGKNVANLNELEYINGQIYANIWTTNAIVIIDPKNGEVTGRISLNGLLSSGDRHANIDVLNGIAYDAENDRLFVTGKRWPKLFEIELVKVEKQ